MQNRQALKKFNANFLHKVFIDKKTFTISVRCIYLLNCC